ncbi:helix-turn-helix domain-containing protein [Halorhodospira halochloris]|uniref:helix-turn-helix domain-containing protein n=1 Tax=Halorhodospira halochloris TaxID=1052 RepID=UPI001EE7D94B|nr:helix-turn-helix domain-containing protein [Halorhodospira halochloris]MCG5531613.1 helix-turn-helix domain-containing protein [Halorhodospira halochloris]
MTQNSRLNQLINQRRQSFSTMPQVNPTDYRKDADSAAAITLSESRPKTLPSPATVPVHTKQMSSADSSTAPRSGHANPATLIQAVIAHRQRHQLTQEQLATELGISVRTLRDWEQGRRRPKGPARALLARWLPADHH